MPKKFVKPTKRKGLSISSPKDLPEIKTKGTPTKTPTPEQPQTQETQLTEQQIIELETANLNNDGYYRYQYLNIMTAIHKQLTDLNENMNGIGEVLGRLTEAVEQQEAEDEGDEE